MGESKVFDETYQDYLKQLKSIDFTLKADALGLQKRDESFLFEFFDRRILFNGNEFSDMEGRPVTFAVKVVLCKYLLMGPETISKRPDRLVSFREFKNAGPLFSNFTANTNKIIETSFSGHVDALGRQCQKNGGVLMESDSYDLSIRFRGLPRIPVILNFNDKDELLPAKSIFLYHDTAEDFLDLECLTITGTYLTGLLINGE